MKILIISDARSTHTQRWVSALKERGLDIILYSINIFDGDFYNIHGIKCYYFDLFGYKRNKEGIIKAIWRHFKAVKVLRQIIEKENPDILHAHFATSYALIAALTRFHPFIVSVWGSDVYIYPKKSLLNRFIVEYSLGKADKILSTSHVMAIETGKYTNKPISITPFGVDISIFKRTENESNKVEPPLDGHTKKEFVIGSVKSLAPNYGTEYLIKAFKIISDNNQNLNCRLEIVGKGPDEMRLKELVRKLGIAPKVFFRGFVDQTELPKLYSSFSIACYLSISESFGVSAIEAMACKCPVVASDAAGFTEVVEDGVTGIIVPKCNPDAAADAIQRFINNPTEINKMGNAARERVCRLYKWSENVEKMISIYVSAI